MHIITNRAIKESWSRYPEARQSLSVWEENMMTFDFKKHEEMKTIFRDPNYIPNTNLHHLTVFNIKGNDFRLVVDMFSKLEEYM